MGRTKKTDETSESRLDQRPALDPEARENQLIALAVNLAEKKLRDGTASTPIISHYLKLATLKEKKELEMLDMQKKLMETKINSIKSSDNSEELTKKAIEAFRKYSGYNGGRVVADEYEDDYYD